MSVPQDVATVLTQSGVDVKSIDMIVLSHAHFDHIGNLSTFPKSTSLLVGPGFKKSLLPGYPSNLSSTILDADYANRKITEINFDFNRDGDSDESTGKVIQLGRFAALDFFGDGSCCPVIFVVWLALLLRGVRTLEERRERKMSLSSWREMRFIMSLS